MTIIDYLTTTLNSLFTDYPNATITLGGDFNQLNCAILQNVFHLTNIVSFSTRKGAIRLLPMIAI